MQSRRLVVVGLAFLLAPVPSAAQDGVEQGSRVRLIPANKFEPRRQGTVMALGADSMTVRLDPVPEWELRGETMEVARSRLEVRVATRRYPRRGAVIGSATLAIAGAWAGHNMTEENCHSSGSNPTVQYCDPTTSPAGILAVAGGIAGAGLGAIAGWLVRHETWRPVVGAMGARVIPAISPRSVGLSLRLTRH